MHPDEVEKIARLARIHLTPEEGRAYAGQLTAILGYFEKLQTLDSAGVEPEAHGALRDAPRRCDRDQAWPEPGPLVQASAHHHDGFFVVPRILP